MCPCLWRKASASRRDTEAPASFAKDPLIQFKKKNCFQTTSAFFKDLVQSGAKKSPNKKQACWALTSGHAAPTNILLCKTKSCNKLTFFSNNKTVTLECTREEPSLSGHTFRFRRLTLVTVATNNSPSCSFFWAKYKWLFGSWYVLIQRAGFEPTITEQKRSPGELTRYFTHMWNDFTKYQHSVSRSCKKAAKDAKSLFHNLKLPLFSSF